MSSVSVIAMLRQLAHAFRCIFEKTSYSGSDGTLPFFIGRYWRHVGLVFLFMAASVSLDGQSNEPAPTPGQI
jgi:hypothetical protein